MHYLNLIKIPYRYIKYLRNQVYPLWATFAITENCNARCEYCQYWRKKYSELSTEDVYKIIRQLKKLGIISVVFSGGECLLRDDLVSIVKYSVDLGLEVTVVTNGLICDEKVFHDIMSCGLRGFAFSLDGSQASIHEAFRKGCSFEVVKHSIQKAVEIKNKNKFNTKISTTTVVNKTNINDLQNIYRLRQSLGADKNFFQPIWPIFGEKHFHKQFGFSDMTFEDLQKIAKELAHIPEGNLASYYNIFPYLYRDFESINDKYQCFAGRAFVYVDSSGSLFPCSPLTHQPMGSLLDESIKSILSKPELKSRLKEYKDFKCGGCTMTCYMEKNIALSVLNSPASLWKRAN